jgi:hypothetical protein
MPLLQQLFSPGTRVRVTQQLPQTHAVWSSSVEGCVVRYRQVETGSWYAHAKNDRLWLDRLELELDDGELVVLNLDHYSFVEDLTDPGKTPEKRNPTEIEMDDRHRP